MRKIKEYPLTGKLQESELRKIPTVELLMLLTVITEASKKITDQIDTAHAKKKSYKKPIDSEWLNRAKSARETKKSHRILVEKELGIRKMAKAKNNRQRNSAA